MKTINTDTDYDLVMLIKQLEQRINNLEDLLTIVTRVLVSKGIYTVQEAFDEYGKFSREKAATENKINLEAEITVE